MGVLHSFSFHVFFNYKIDLRLFLFSCDDLTKYYHLSRSIFSEKIIFIPFLDPKIWGASSASSSSWRTSTT